MLAQRLGLAGAIDTDDETEAIGLALMRLEEAVREMSALFDLAPDELNLDLGPIGRLV